jgi:hypothetical protein
MLTGNGVIGVNGTGSKAAGGCTAGDGDWSRSDSKYVAEGAWED